MARDLALFQVFLDAIEEEVQALRTLQRTPQGDAAVEAAYRQLMGAYSTLRSVRFEERGAAHGAESRVDAATVGALWALASTDH